MKPTGKVQVEPAPLGGAKFLSPRQVFALLGYTDPSTAWKAIKRAGIPFVRVNPRRCLFEESEVRAWLDRRTVGRKAS